jgi:hypothetical protein
VVTAPNNNRSSGTSVMELALMRLYSSHMNAQGLYRGVHGSVKVVYVAANIGLDTRMW